MLLPEATRHSPPMTYLGPKTRTGLRLELYAGRKMAVSAIQPIVETERRFPLLITAQTGGKQSA